MGKIAIKSINHRNLAGELFFKRDLLLFDKIIIDQNGFTKAKDTYEFLLKHNKAISNFIATDKSNFNFNLQSIDYLGEKGLIEFRKVVDEIKDSFYEDQYVPQLLDAQWRKACQKVEDSSLYDFFDSHNKPSFGIAVCRISDYICRLYSSYQLDIESSNVYPLLDSQATFEQNTISKKFNVMNVLLNKFPVPNEDTPFEQILEFRQDADTQAKYYNLMNWINSVATGKEDLSEVEDNFLYLYHSYIAQYNLHKVKYSHSALEIIITGLGGLIENLCKIKFSEASKQIFSLFKEDVKLLEEEQKFIGREIAYIHKANKTFKN